MHHFGFFLCRITAAVSPGELAEMERVAQGNSGEMFLRPRGAMQDREGQGVSDRKVSGTETIFLVFQKAKFQKAWAHMHIPETHIQERSNSDHGIGEGRK